MTIHQLYDGGPANSTIARTQWPAYPFLASDPAFAAVDVAVHNGYGVAQLRRTLDFKNDYALRGYFTRNAVAAADVLNVLLLPAKSLLLGCFVQIEAVNDSGTANTLKFGTAAGIIIGDTTGAAVAVDATVLSSNYSAPNGPWVNGTGGGVVSLATAQYIGTYPDMLQVTLATLATASLAGFGNLRLNVEATILKLGENPSTNF
jgi:hypothetical protein